MACIYGAGQQPVFVVELVVGTYFTWYTHNTQYQVPVQVREACASGGSVGSEMVRVANKNVEWISR